MTASLATKEQLPEPRPLDCTPIVRAATEKYVQAKLELERVGSANKRQLEEVRSYAVEALQALLYENPNLCSYKRRMDAVIAERMRK